MQARKGDNEGKLLVRLIVLSFLLLLLLQLAAAGFYFIGGEEEGSTQTKCFMCHKCLDGWEPTDDPMQEHKSHSPK